MQDRFERVTYGNRCYYIPSFWMMGFMQTHKEASILDVIKWWDYQARLEEQYQAQQVAS